MRIHKRLIDLTSPSEIVKQIVRGLPSARERIHSHTDILSTSQTSMSIEPGVDVEVTLSEN